MLIEILAGAGLVCRLKIISSFVNPSSFFLLVKKVIYSTSKGSTAILKSFETPKLASVGLQVARLALV